MKLAFPSVIFFVVHEDRLVNCKHARQCSKFWISKKNACVRPLFPNGPTGHNVLEIHKVHSWLPSASCRVSAISFQGPTRPSWTCKTFARPWKNWQCLAYLAGCFFFEMCFVWRRAHLNFFKYVRLFHFKRILQPDNHVVFFQSLGATNQVYFNKETDLLMWKKVKLALKLEASGSGTLWKVVGFCSNCFGFEQVLWLGGFWIFRFLWP